MVYTNKPIQSIVDVIDFNVRAFTPFAALRQGFQPPAVLWADYTTGIPLWEILVAFYSEHYLLGMSLLSTLATVIYTIFLGTLQLSSSFYGGATFEADLAASTACSLLAGFILAVNLALGWHFAWRRDRFLNRPTLTLAAVIPFVVFSPKLREDLNGLVPTLKKTDKIRELVHSGRRYGLGVFRVGGREFLGVERHYESGDVHGLNIEVLPGDMLKKQAKE